MSLVYVHRTLSERGLDFPMDRSVSLGSSSWYPKIQNSIKSWTCWLHNLDNSGIMINETSSRARPAVAWLKTLGLLWVVSREENGFTPHEDYNTEITDSS
jgi:hypothetical protein